MIIHHLKKLISFPSITPYDFGCQDYIINFLQTIGFKCEKFNCYPVSNFFAYFGKKNPLLLFCGHTDVVPIGNINKWKSNPFTIKMDKNTCYGRGTADMKGAIVSMMIMAKKIMQKKNNFSGSLGFLITSGEEGNKFYLGTPYIMKKIMQKGILPKFCILGEPSSEKKIGDTIKIGRRGSLTGKLIFHGIQGHVGYPNIAINPIHKIVPILTKLITKKWDKGNKYFSPTSFQVTRIHSESGSENIIPDKINIDFNFRFSTKQTVTLLIKKCMGCFHKNNIYPNIYWKVNAYPFLTLKSNLLKICMSAIKEITGLTTNISTDGGTSDGRFIIPYKAEVIELGLINKSIHKYDENTTISDIQTLSDIYYNISKNILLNNV